MRQSVILNGFIASLRDEFAKGVPDLVRLLKDKVTNVQTVASTVLCDLINNSKETAQRYKNL